MTVRHYSPRDRFIIGLDRCLAAVLPPRETAAGRPSPADQVADAALTEPERRHVEGLMRVNHAGEVSAQALYQGQAITSRDAQVRQTMQQSAREEIDHLAWCQQRLDELGGHASYLNPLWYLGSFTIGTLAGLAGDKWSLGFVAETERQVVKHLRGHLQRLPAQDVKSRVILEQMMEDEARHGATAMASGGMELPAPVQKAMRYCSRIMTTTAYRV